jgi:hypothetical protein
MASRWARAPACRRGATDAAMTPRSLPVHARRHRRWSIAAALWLGGLGLACACAGGRDGHRVPAAADHEPRDSSTPTIGERSTTASDDGALSEAAARALLAERFRASGLRVRYDVPVARDDAFALTVDGYDPVRRVGFEYVADDERDTDLDDDERAALARDPEQRILIVDAADAAAVDALAERFLHTVQSSEEPAPR